MRFLADDEIEFSSRTNKNHGSLKSRLRRAEKEQLRNYELKSDYTRNPRVHIGPKLDEFKVYFLICAVMIGLACLCFVLLKIVQCMRKDNRRS